MPRWHEISVHSLQTNCDVGYIKIEAAKHFRILAADGHTIGTTDCLTEAVNTLTTYYETPSRWRSHEPMQHFKCTPFGFIEVKQDEDGYWYVYRNSDHYLIRDGEAATFATLEEAQRAADLHVRDPLTDLASSDGLSWYIQPKFQMYRKCVIADNTVTNSG